MENEVIRTLCERRSVRRYKPDMVDEEALSAILKAGTYAATGMGRQSPVIICVEDPDTREQLRRMNASVMGNPESDPFYGAPVVVIVLADRNIMTCVEDGSLVIGNMMNAAYSVGVDSCWIHRAREEFDSAEGKALLKKWGVSGDYRGVGHLILGYRADDLPVPRERKKDYIIRVK